MGLNCHECDDKLKEERGCFKKGIVPFYINEEVFFRCPNTFITPVSLEYIKAYIFFKKSILPNGNGWANESQKFLDAMLALDQEISKQEQEKTKNA